MSDAPITLTDAAVALRSGAITSVELLRAATAQADALDARLGVYVNRLDEYALARAEQADAELSKGVDKGLLHGIPIGVKDILAMQDGPTTANSLILDREWGASDDAIVVERLKAAGAVITGKLVTMEFAIGMPDFDKPFPIPRNPWNTDTWPGGSSSGTGAGVASGMFLAGVGTDTGGSIRLPAVFCGVSGLMPTYGRVPNAGCAPLGYSLDHIGPLARSARDCGAFLGAIAGGDPRDSYAVDLAVPDYLAGLDGSLAGVRVGVERANHFKDTDDPAVEPLFDAAVAALEARGATVVEVTIPHYAETLTAVWVTMLSEAFAYHRGDLQDRWEDYFEATRTLVGLGAAYSGADYVQAQRVRRVAQRDLQAMYQDVDLIVTPSATVAGPTYEEIERTGLTGITSNIFTSYWDGVGNPALVVPMGQNAGGMPMSLQIAARPFEEQLLIRAGDAFQQETDWHLQVPPLATTATATAV